MIILSERVIATPPGATIKEQLKIRNMTQKDFALQMKLPDVDAKLLLDGEIFLTSELAEQLEAVLGVPAYFWTNLEKIYREKVREARQETGNI